jgi:hypothetical protein
VHARELRPRRVGRDEERARQDVAAEHEAALLRHVQRARAEYVHRQPAEQDRCAVDRAVPEQLLQRIAAVGAGGLDERDVLQAGVVDPAQVARELSGARWRRWHGRT